MKTQIMGFILVGASLSVHAYQNDYSDLFDAKRKEAAFTSGAMSQDSTQAQPNLATINSGNVKKSRLSSSFIDDLVTNAQTDGSVCSTETKDLVRYISNTMKYCDGSRWIDVPTGGTSTTPPPPSGASCHVRIGFRFGRGPAITVTGIGSKVHISGHYSFGVRYVKDASGNNTTYSVSSQVTDFQYLDKTQFYISGNGGTYGWFKCNNGTWQRP